VDLFWQAYEKWLSVEANCSGLPPGKWLQQFNGQEIFKKGRLDTLQQPNDTA